MTSTQNVQNPAGVYYIGVDIGSISINTVVLDREGNILEDHYEYCHGQPFKLLNKNLRSLFDKYGPDNLGGLAFTGTGGELGTKLTGGVFVNEIIAQSVGVGNHHPEIRTIIEIGGEDSKLIFMDQQKHDGHARMSDFNMNTLCAAGTGSFLDQQSKRLGIKIENEFGELALQSGDPPRIAGRCSVFAKTDMIHLQQIATPVQDIVAGLCFAVARNFLSTVGRGKEIQYPVSLQGGVAANVGVRRAFRELLDADESKLIVPDHFASLGAIGAVTHAFLDGQEKEGWKFGGLEKLEEYLSKTSGQHKAHQKLHRPEYEVNKEVYTPSESEKPVAVALGIDVGSLSTNLVLIDAQNRVIARRYLPTAGKPLEAIRGGLASIQEEIGDDVKVIAAGTTGSGRYLTGDFIGADTIRNEITAQATAAIAIDPKVDTIFEIGGQDSKYISIDNGVVVDFEMNKVCAAGTGSFLEEQAEKLDINIIEEFANLALEAGQPAKLGDRCTVFMESDLNAHQQRGVNKENLVGGLAYSIVQNYIQKVVRNKRIGNYIFFQGGVTNNRSVVAAFEKVTGKSIKVPPHFDVTGAIGAAILARDYVEETGVNKTRFKGFDVSKVPYTVSKFTCKGCSNQCEIRKVNIEGEKKALFFGGRCEKYEKEERKGKGEGIPDLFRERTEMLLEGYEKSEKDDRISIGIPMGLMIFYQQFPLWNRFFEELNFRVVHSRPSDRQLVRTALEVMSAETCLPVEVMHGHIQDLLEQDVDYIFAPFIVNVPGNDGDMTSDCNCPWVQTYPFMVRSAFHHKLPEGKMLSPTLHLKFYPGPFSSELSRFMKKNFGIPASKVKRALKTALEQQKQFEAKAKKRGQEILNDLPQDLIKLVILGRPYNTGDPELNLKTVEKLINQNVLPIPLDFLPLESMHITEDYPSMYWPNGQRILAGARYVAQHEDLFALYISNFRCGPDSFLTHYVHDEMKGKPYLEIEIDEHSADAGLITRYEAFLDSLRAYKLKTRKEAHKRASWGLSSSPQKDRILYFPYMCDAAYAIAAATRGCDMPSEVLPMQTEEDLELGRKYTTSKECFPMICTTGSFLKKLMEPGVNPSRVSFFMPDHNGPCRFGQYNRLQRIIFDKLGFQDARIISPGNDSAYTDISGGQGTRFRLNAWKGFVAVDLLRKLKQERKPYEINPGEVEQVYRQALQNVIHSVENGSRDLPGVMEEAGKEFQKIALDKSNPRPVVAVVGEIFMRDNPFCSGFLVQKLEKMGAETFIAPFSEWIVYSTYRYTRDSLWKSDYVGLFKSKIQKISQDITQKRIEKGVHHLIDAERDIKVKQMLELCHPYIDKDYDGDPALNLGTSAALYPTGISGVANILPFTCLPGTVVSALSDRYREDHDNIPYVNIPYDGQEDSSLEIRLQAFMHQVYEFAEEKSRAQALTK